MFEKNQTNSAAIISVEHAPKGPGCLPIMEQPPLTGPSPAGAGRAGHVWKWPHRTSLPRLMQCRR